MIPVIDSLEKIDHVLAHLPVWRGKQRLRVLSVCTQALANLHFKKEITATQQKEYNGKLYRPIVEARIRERKQAHQVN